MTDIDETIVPIIKYITGESPNICRLCFCTLETVNYLDEYCFIQSHYFVGNLTFEEILKELEALTEPTVSYKLCEECANLAAKAFLFKKLCQHSIEKWCKTVERLENTLEQRTLDSLGSNVNTAYFLVQKDKDLVLTSRKTQTVKTKQAVVQKIKALLKDKRRKKHLEKKNKHGNSDGKKSTCEFCLKVFRTISSMNVHKDRMHKPKTIKCSECPGMFSSQKMLKYHYSCNHIPAQCKQCLLEFKGKRELHRHLSTHDSNLCRLCSKEFKNKFALKAHMKICGENEKNMSVYCDICFKEYNRKNSLRSHLIIEHGFGQSHVCNWCNKKFDAISKLKAHEVKHTRERNFSCELCGGQFVTRAALTYHFRIHTGEKPYPCDLCDQSFLSASRRMEHKRRKHFGPQYPCSICDSKFSTKFESRKHAARHKNPQSRLYVASEYNGKKHVRNTTEEKNIFK